MRIRNEETMGMSPQGGWQEIQATLEEARSSMYLAGSAAILVLWGVIASLAYVSQYATETLAADFATRNPWISAPLWGILAVVGMVGSAVIGHRAGKDSASGDAMRSAGLRVFFYWLAVVAAVFLVPAAAGMWNEDSGANIPHVAIGIVALGYVLFGIMNRPMIAVIGAGIAAAFYIPSFLAGDAALVISAAATLTIALLGALWIRRSGVL